MSRLLKTILLTPSGGAAKLEYRKDANLFSAYNVDSSIPIEELTVTLTSLATLSIAEVKIVASLSSAIALMTYQSIIRLTASPSSVYSLATAPT